MYVHCFQQCLELFSAQQFSHQLLLLLCFSLLRCSCSAYGCPHCYFSFVTALIQQALPTLPFLICTSFNMTFDFLFFVPCFVHLSFLYVDVCTLLRGVLSSEKHFFAALLPADFRSLSIQDCVALLQGVSGNNAANRLCHHFLSDFCITRHLLRFLVAHVQHVLHLPSS